MFYSYCFVILTFFFIHGTVFIHCKQCIALPIISALSENISFWK